MRQTERAKRLAALEAQAEAERARAEAKRMEAAREKGPPYWCGCMLCGNLTDPRWQDPEDRRCYWCGGRDAIARWGPEGWTQKPAHHRCPRCDDEHGPEARVPSEWNRAGACPACGAAPPPTEAEPTARFDAWCAWIGVADADA